MPLPPVPVTPFPARSRFEALAPWLVGNLFVLGLFGRDLLRFDDGRVATGAFWGRDFINVWTAGRLLLEGRLSLLYDMAAYHTWQVAQFGEIGVHNFSYPPLVLPLMLPFGALPYPVALAAWLAFTGALFVHAARPWWREATGWPAWAVLLTPAATINIWAGHYGFLIAALLLYGWRALERGRPHLAGLCFGLLAIKPHLAVLVPLVLLVRGEWRAIAAAAATVGALVGASVLLFPPVLWAEYLGVTAGVQAAMIDAGDGFFRYMSTSLATALIAAGMSKGTALAAQALAAAVAMALVARAARHARLRDVALLAATATFLVLPYAFNYDLTLSAMAAAMLLARPLGAVDQRLALGGFMAAQVGMALIAAGLPGMPMLLAGLLVAQYRSAMRKVAGTSGTGTSHAGGLPAISSRAVLPAGASGTVSLTASGHATT